MLNSILITSAITVIVGGLTILVTAVVWNRRTGRSVPRPWSIVVILVAMAIGTSVFLQWLPNAARWIIVASVLAVFAIVLGVFVWLRVRERGFDRRAMVMSIVLVSSMLAAVVQVISPR